MQHYIVDIETLGLEPSSVVLGVGIVRVDLENPVSFDEYCNDGFVCSISVKDQVDAGRKIDESTKGWWKQQSEKVLNMLFGVEDSDKATIRQALDMIDNYTDSKDAKFWIRAGNQQFLLDLAKGYKGKSLIWKRSSWLDLGTGNFIFHGKSYHESPELFELYDRYIQHYPLHDAAFEAVMLTTE